MPAKIKNIDTRTITLGTMPAGEHYITIRDRSQRLWVWDGERFKPFIIPQSMRSQAKLYTDRGDLFLDLSIILGVAQFQVDPPTDPAKAAGYRGDREVKLGAKGLR